VEHPRSGAVTATITESQSPRPPQGGWGKPLIFTIYLPLQNILLRFIYCTTVTKEIVTKEIVTKEKERERGERKNSRPVTKLTA